MAKNKAYIILEATDKATAVVKGFDKNTEQAFDRMKKNAKASTTSMGSSLQKLKQHWLAVAAAMAGVILGLKKCVTAASDLQETTSKFEVVFADQIKRAEEFADALVDSYAMSTRESKQFLSSIQDLLVPMGMQRDLAGQLSFEIVKLSADLGSFNNLPTAQVMADVQSALVGNYETMKKYGVVINATMVQEKALAMGLARTKDELTVAQKAYAAYTMIVEDSEAAVGDMARTQDDYANTVKRFKAATEDLAASIGASLLPALTETFGWLAKIVSKYLEWVQGPSVVDMLKDQKKEIELQLEQVKQQYEYGKRFAHVLEAQGHSTEMANELYIGQIALLQKRLDLITKSIAEEERLAARAAKGGPEPTGPGIEGGGDGAPTIETARLINEAKAQYYLDDAARKEKLLRQDIERMNTAAEFELETARLINEAKAQYYLDDAALKEEVLKQDIKRMNTAAQKEKAIEAAKAQMAKQAAKIMLANWSDAFAQLAKGSKTAFALWKATAIAQTIVDTYAAAQAAYKAMAGIPVVGPALGVAAAAAAIAAGMARVSAIQQQTPAAMYHQGGIVGQTAVSHRFVPAETFAAAPRLHRGLKSDEFPAILQKGEEVIPADEGYEVEDTPILQVALIADGRELTKLMIHRTEIDGTLLNRLRKALA